MPAVTPLSALLMRYRRALREKRANCRAYSTNKCIVGLRPVDCLHRLRSLDSCRFCQMLGRLAFRILGAQGANLAGAYSAITTIFSRLVNQYPVSRAFETNASLFQLRVSIPICQARQEKGFCHLLHHDGAGAKLNNCLRDALAALVNFLFDLRRLHWNLANCAHNFIFTGFWRR